MWYARAYICHTSMHVCMQLQHFVHTVQYVHVHLHMFTFAYFGVSRTRQKNEA